MANVPKVTNEREQIEGRILSAARWGSAAYCEDEDHARPFFDAWIELAQYFRTHDDASIGVEVVREYLDVGHLLFVISQDANESDECRERAAEDLQELQSLLDDIIDSVNQRRQSAAS